MIELYVIAYFLYFAISADHCTKMSDVNALFCFVLWMTQPDDHHMEMEEVGTHRATRGTIESDEFFGSQPSSKEEAFGSQPSSRKQCFW